jgi:hypothetical protein
MGGMKPLPLPVRLAAGLVATAVEQARDLPRHVVELPVTAVSQALQVSMRVQQRVTELAIKGDRALGVLRPVEEKPSWATFDEDLPRNGVSTVTELRRPPVPVPVVTPEPAYEPVPEDADVPDTTGTAPDDGYLSDLPVPADPPALAVAPEPADPPAAVLAPQAEGGPGDGPSALPGYPGMSIPQLRGHLRRLTVDDLRLLLAWETTHDDRPQYVTMLTNRIATVSES